MITDKEYAIERYVEDLETSYVQLLHYKKYLNFHGNEEEIMDEAISELSKLISNLKKCKTVKEAKEYIKIGKLVDKYN